MPSFDPHEEALDEHIFELANAPAVRYRDLTFGQAALDECSGGVVWESAFVLLEYFLGSAEATSLDGVVCEVGAGCGLLGSALAKYRKPRPKRVVVTEHPAALDHLAHNIERNADCGCTPEVALLDWCAPRGHCSLTGAFDAIVGTDVCFSPQLVVPLVRTCARLCRDERSVAWLCFPRRCERSWNILENALPKHFALVELVTSDLHAAVPVAARLEVELWKCSGRREEPSAEEAGARGEPSSSAGNGEASGSAEAPSSSGKKRKKRKRPDG